jgi:hypothetical protein
MEIDFSITGNDYVLCLVKQRRKSTISATFFPQKIVGNGIGITMHLFDTTTSNWPPSGEIDTRLLVVLCELCFEVFRSIKCGNIVWAGTSSVQQL